MKAIFISLLAALAGVTAAAAYMITADTIHTFRSTEGKAVRGKIVRYCPEKETVDIKTEDRGTHRVQLSILSDADRAFIREWHTVKDFFRQEYFHISISRGRPGMDDLVWRTQEAVIYGIRLENRCRFDMTDLTLEYSIHYELHDPNLPEPTADRRVKSGTRKIAALASGKSTTVQTEPVMIPAEKDLEYYKAGEIPGMTFNGIRLRIYLPLKSGNKALREFSEPRDLTEKQERTE